MYLTLSVAKDDAQQGRMAAKLPLRHSCYQGVALSASRFKIALVGPRSQLKPIL
jgi:hypothetical protein